MTAGAAGGGVERPGPCRHISCSDEGPCIRRPRRTRAQVDADALDTTLERWRHHLTNDEYDSGLTLLHALRELESASAPTRRN